MVGFDSYCLIYRYIKPSNLKHLMYFLPLKTFTSCRVVPPPLCARAHMFIEICVCMHTYIYIYIDTHAYVCVCMNAWVCCQLISYILSVMSFIQLLVCSMSFLYSLFGTLELWCLHYSLESSYYIVYGHPSFFIR